MGDDWEAVDISAGDPAAYQRVGIRGEPFQTWVRRLTEMQQAVRLWEAVRGLDRDVLTGMIRWEKDDADNPVVVYDPIPELPLRARPKDGSSRRVEVIASTQMHPEWFSRFREGDTVLPARVILNRLVSEQLKGKVAPALVHDFKEVTTVLRLIPESLLGCLWLQLAEAISTLKDIRPCPVCRQWFDVKGRARKDKQFCGNACRLRAYRGRKEKARQLHAAGNTVTEIATELDADREAVKGWIKDVKGKKGK